MTPITVAGPEGRRDVEVTYGPSATIADLAVALALNGDEGLIVDGSPAQAAASPHEAGLVAGSVLAAAPAPAVPAGAVRLAVLAGPGAGTIIPLSPGTHRLGDSHGGKLTLRVTATGAVHVSRRGRGERRLGPGSLLATGGAVLGVLPTEAAPPRRMVPGRRGTVPFNRPPREMSPEAASPVRLPDPPPPPPIATRVGVAALVVPLLLAGVMAVVADPRFALFGLLGPVMLAGTWVEDRRRRRRHTRDGAAAQVAAADTLRRDLMRARRAEALRRRRHLPTVPELAGRAGGSAGMWERLPGHADFMRLAAGYGCAPWIPPLIGDPESAPEWVRSVLAEGPLPAAPIPLELTAGQVLGVAGLRLDALALARGLMAQAVALHGPAHLQVAVVTDHPGDWDWVKWAPHTLARSSSGRRLLAATPADEATVTGLLLPAVPPAHLAAVSTSPTDPLTLLVVDVDDISRPDHTSLRHVLGGRGVAVAALVLGPERAQLPALCTAVAEVAGGRVRLPDGEHLIAGATEEAALTLARALARWDDPDRPDDGAELPASVPLLDILDMPAPAPEQVAARWRACDRPAAPLGVTDAGPLVVDLLADGPHGLLGGTTGSGKSELLRTLVASLAATVDPEHLVFVLVDYKGGSAFDACAALPHTAGLVTDLDDSLAERALRCLEAELRYREERLRRAGADSLLSFTVEPGDEPLPRMLIVIDEFAALAKELPDFMEALVDIAARGRSLGVHLLLATQRPAGVIRDNVRANTNLRIALRVQDSGDSTDVLGDARAASIPRSQPGRGYLRLGPAEVVAFQAATVTGGQAGGSDGVTARPFDFGAEPPAAAPAVESDDETSPTDLDLLVAAVAAAARREGMAPVRRPWPDPLPDRLLVADVDAASPPSDTAVPLGLIDEPDRQRQATRWWDPRAGSTILYGVAGSGTTTALATMALGLAAAHPPDAVHAYVLDCDAGALAPLARLPHVGAVVGPHETERQRRLLRMLVAEMEARRGVRRHGADPTVVLFVDGYHTFAAAHQGIHDEGVREALDRLIADGPAAGICVVATVSRYNAIPTAVAAAVEAKLLFRTADPTAATMLGVRSVPADMPPGRCIDTATGRLVQIASPGDITAAAPAVAESRPGARGGPPPVEELPAAVKVPDVAEWLHLDDDVWHIPVGIGDNHLAPVGWRLGEGDHALVAGETRSGRSTLLAALATMVAERSPETTILGIAPRRSPLRDVPGLTRLITDPADIGAALADLSGVTQALVLIDDADDLDDPDGSLGALAGQRHPGIHVVAAARRDIKARFGHWARELCRSRQGLWLQPSDGVDGDLWSTTLPRRVPIPMPPGRGYLVAGGAVEVVQAVM